MNEEEKRQISLESVKHQIELERLEHEAEQAKFLERSRSVTTPTSDIDWPAIMRHNSPESKGYQNKVKAIIGEAANGDPSEDGEIDGLTEPSAPTTNMSPERFAVHVAVCQLADEITRLPLFSDRILVYDIASSISWWTTGDNKSLRYTPMHEIDLKKYTFLLGAFTVVKGWIHARNTGATLPEVREGMLYSNIELQRNISIQMPEVPANLDNQSSMGDVGDGGQLDPQSTEGEGC